MDAILYTSNTGNTERYAEMLSEKTGLPAYALAKAPAELKGKKIIYMGWVMATMIQGLADALGSYDVQAVCAVGMAPQSNEKVLSDLREKNGIDLPLFYLPGGFYLKKLSGMYKMMMSMVIGKLKSELKKKENLTDADRKTLAAFTDGIDLKDEKFLQPILDYLS